MDIIISLVGTYTITIQYDLYYIHNYVLQVPIYNNHVAIIYGKHVGFGLGELGATFEKSTHYVCCYVAEKHRTPYQ